MARKYQIRSFFTRLLLTLFLCPTSPVTFAQIPRLYNTQRGLTTSNINDITVDSRGIVWISGARSLETFDGYDFHPISLYDETTNRNLCSSVNSIDEIGAGKYLIHTNSGLYVYSIHDGSFKRISFDGKEGDKGYPSAYSTPYIKKGQRLIVTSGWGVYIFDDNKLDIDHKESKFLQNALKESFFHHTFLDSHGNLWANYHDYTLHLFSTRKMKHVDFNISPDANEALKSSPIKTITEAGDKIYIGISSKILVYNYKTNRLATLISDLHSPINVLAPSNGGRILIGTDSDGLLEMDSDGNICEYPIAQASFSMEYAKVKCIERLTDGTLILGMLQKGLLVIPPPSKDFNYYAISPHNDGINASCITSMVPGWVATDGCGPFKTESADGNAQRITEGLKSTLVQSVITDARGTAWIGSYGGGVQYYDGSRFVSPEWMKELGNAPVMSIVYDSTHDVIYIGTNGMGVFKADLPAHKLTSLTETPINNAWISALYLDEQASTLWAGAPSGLYYANTKTMKGGMIENENISGLDINSIKTDDLHVFIGTSMGLIILDKNKPHDKDLQQNILKEERVMGMEIAGNDLWISTSSSIVRVAGIINSKDIKTDNGPSLTTYKSFGGAYLGEFHHNSSMTSSTGRILFGADNGIISFDPNDINKNTRIKHPIIITSISIGNRKTTITVPEHVDLEPNENAFIATFSSPNLALPQRIQYEYMLTGIDNGWRSCHRKPQAKYSGLNPGTYTLKIKAYDESDRDNYIETSLVIHVKTYWYASVWAWIVYILIIATLIYKLYWAYKLRQLQQKEIQHIRQEEKLKEARLNLFTSITHELRSPLTMIVSPLKQLMTSDNDKSHQYLYNIMMRNSQRLLNIVKQITDITKIDSGKLKLQFHEVNFINYSNSIYDTYAPYAAMKNISFIVEHNVKSLSVWIDPDHFEKIITNLLSNAFKFTPENGKIIVRTNIRDNQMELRFYNTGFDSKEENINLFFDRFYQGSNAAGKQGSGIGLSLVYELTKMHHGDISAHNVEPDGIEFVLHFPTGNTHLSTDEIVSDKETSPIQKEELKAELAELTQDEEANRHEQAKRHTLLMVDDDKELCQYIVSQMSDQYNVITAYSGNSAWQQVLTARPDVVVTDIRMPDGDGMELTKRIKSNPETDNIPIIMLTSESDDATRMQSLNLKVDHFLPKPFNLLMLHGAIGQALHVRENLMQRTVRKDVVSGDYTRVTLTSIESKLFERINKSIQDHLDDSEYGVEEMANEVGISRVHLNRKMKEHYGVSPNTFIKTYRLKQAAYLLVHTSNVNISEVAYTVGFSTAAYFSTSFRAHFGMTPKEFVAHYSDNLDDETLQKLLV